jgi:hypothetical protein
MTAEQTEGNLKQEGARFLPDKTVRKLLISGGRGGIRVEDLNKIVLDNQARFGYSPDDYVGIVQAHQNVVTLSNILGIQEEVRKSCMVSVDGKDMVFIEETPKVRNIWVGKYTRLLTPAEAEETNHSGRTALAWATRNGVVPEMVAKARDGFFYPATANDIAIQAEIK